MRSNRFFAAVSAIALSVAVPIAAAGPAAAITPEEALASGAIGGYSTGSVLALEAATGDPGTLANVSVAQSAADVNVGRDFVDEDLLGNAILFAEDAEREGKNAYGHGSAVNVGIGQATNEVPQVAPAVSEALSPPPTVAEPGGGELPEELGELVRAGLLGTTAQANTTSVDSICPAEGDLISEGTAEAANAALLNVIPPTPPETENGSIVAADGVVRSVSRTFLEGTSLVTETTQSIAPISLLGGELNIEVVHLLQLRALAAGGPGSELFYGFVNAETGERVPDSEPVVFVNGEGLTTEDLFGEGGLRLALGVADVIIGAPAHGLDDDPNSDPTVTDTTVAGAADLIRVTIPGTLPVPTENPFSPGSPFEGLNEALNPLLEGLEPLLAGIQEGLQEAGVTAADLRIGHLEALAVVPEGGIICGECDPFANGTKRVSTETVNPGQEFSYTINFTNECPFTATDVVITDTFAQGLEYRGGSGTVTSDDDDSRDLDVPDTAEGNTVRIDVGDVNTGDTVNIVLNFRAPANAVGGTQFRNDADITGVCEGQDCPAKRVSVLGPTVVQPQLPRTGMETGAAALGILLLGGGALVARRRLGQQA